MNKPNHHPSVYRSIYRSLFYGCSGWKRWWTVGVRMVKTHSYSGGVQAKRYEGNYLNVKTIWRTVSAARYQFDRHVHCPGLFTQPGTTAVGPSCNRSLPILWPKQHLWIHIHDTTERTHNGAGQCVARSAQTHVHTGVFLFAMQNKYISLV
jgi:hypothetical protein